MIFLRFKCLQFFLPLLLNSETVMKAGANIEEAMRYFNRELRVTDWRTFSLRALVNFHLTLTINHGTSIAVRQSSLS